MSTTAFVKVRLVTPFEAPASDRLVTGYWLETTLKLCSLQNGDKRSISGDKVMKGVIRLVYGDKRRYSTLYTAALTL